MFDLPEGRRGHVLALAISIAVLALLWFGFVDTVLDWQADQAERVASREQFLARAQVLVARLPEMQAEAARRATGVADTGLLLQGQTDSVAAAELQQTVQRLVLDAGGRLASVEILPTEQMGGYRRIALRVSLQATYAAEIAILRSIAASRPGMLVDDLKLQAPAIRNPSMPMDATFTVLSYRAGTAA